MSSAAAASASSATSVPAVIAQKSLGGASASAADVTARRAKVSSMLSGDAGRLLAAALEDPPFGAADDVKAQAVDVVATALGAIKEPQMKAAVESLSMEQCDVLMKYLYKLLGAGDQYVSMCGALLKWHAAVVEAAGVGSIVRVLTEQPAL